MTLFVFQSESLFGPKLLNPHCDQCNRSNKIYQIAQNLLENNGSIAVIDRVLGLGLAEEWQFFKTSASDKHFIPRPRLISIWSTSASANLGGETEDNRGGILFYCCWGLSRICISTYDSVYYIIYRVKIHTHYTLHGNSIAQCTLL